MRRVGGRTVAATALAVTLGAGPGLGSVRATASADETHLQTVVNSTVVALQNYWSAQMPAALGVEYVPISQWLYYEGVPSAAPLHCDIPLADYANNAYYCSDDHAIAYDMDFFRSMHGELFTREQDMVPVLILAHEMGHAVDFVDGGFENQAARRELKADCLAGNFLAAVSDPTNSLGLYLESGDIEEAIIDVQSLADRPDAPWFGSTAHGQPAERSQALTIGRLAGANGAYMCDWFDHAQPPEPLTWSDGTSLRAVPGTQVINDAAASVYRLSHPALPALSVQVTAYPQVSGDAVAQIVDVVSERSSGTANVVTVAPLVGLPRLSMATAAFTQVVDGQAIAGVAVLAVSPTDGALLIVGFSGVDQLSSVQTVMPVYLVATLAGWNVVGPVT